MAIDRKRAEQIVKEYYDDIYYFCCLKLQEKEEARDITQEVFLLFFEKLKTLDDDKLKAWLYSVSRNKINDKFRERKKEQKIISIDDDNGHNIFNRTEYSYKISDEDFEEDAKTDWDKYDEAEKKILSILTKEERELFFRVFVKREKKEAMADEMNITENNLYTKIYRLRKKIRKYMGYLALFVNILIFKINF